MKRSSCASIFIDANLLLLLVIGAMDRSLIGSFKRTNEFTTIDFDNLVALIGRSNAIVITPHILTEVSNLANALRDDQKHMFAETFRLLIDGLQEKFTAATVLSQHSLFRFGIAGTSAIHASEGMLFLTQDGRFASQVLSKGGVAMSLHAAVAEAYNV